MGKKLTPEQEDMLRKAFVCALDGYLTFKNMKPQEVLSLIHLETIPNAPLYVRCCYGDLRKHEIKINGRVDFSGDFTRIGAEVISVNTLSWSRTYNHTVVLDNIEERFAKIFPK